MATTQDSVEAAMEVRVSSKGTERQQLREIISSTIAAQAINCDVYSANCSCES